MQLKASTTECTTVFSTTSTRHSCRCGSKCGWGTSFSSRSESREQAVGVGRNVDGEQALVVDQKVESKL
jgi:hypothetical protein